MAKRLKILIPPIAVTLLVACGTRTAPPGKVNQAAPTVVPSPSDEVPNVAFCDMARDPKHYAGRRVRTEAILSAGLETSLMYSPDCFNRESLLTYQSDNREAYNALYNGLETHRGGKPITRVDATVIGRLDGPSKEGFGHLNAFKYQFAVVSVEKVSAVPPEVAWP